LNNKSQNGLIVERQPIEFSSEEVEKINESDPKIEKRLDKVSPFEITYCSDGFNVKGYLVVPRSEGSYPCLIYNRGGSRSFGAIGREKVGTFLTRVASWGYVVVASQYRGNCGGEGKEEYGGEDVKDMLNLFPLLESIQEADTDRIGAYGRSRGGMMTYILLRQTSHLAAAIVDAGVSNMFSLAKDRPELEEVWQELIPNYHSEKRVALKERSALFWPEELDKETPILILHGSGDWRSPLPQGLEMARSLYDCRHPFRSVFFEGGDHQLNEHRAEVFRIIKSWLNRYVRDLEKWPSLEPHGE